MCWFIETDTRSALSRAPSWRLRRKDCPNRICKSESLVLLLFTLLSGKEYQYMYSFYGCSVSLSVCLVVLMSWSACSCNLIGDKNSLAEMIWTIQRGINFRQLNIQKLFGSYSGILIKFFSMRTKNWQNDILTVYFLKDSFVICPVFMFFL